MLRIQFHRLYLEDPLTHGKVREPLHRHRDLPVKGRSCLAYRVSAIKWWVLRWRFQVTQLWYKRWFIWATKQPPSLQAAWPGTCWEAQCEPIIPPPVLMVRELDGGHRITLLQTLHHIVCCSGSSWAQGGISVLNSSWGILLLWISPDDLLHPDKLSASSVSVFCSSAPRELKNHFTVFMPNMQLDSLVLDKNSWPLLTSFRSLGIWSIKSGILFS